MRNAHIHSLLSFRGQLYSPEIHLPLPLPLFRVMNVLLAANNKRVDDNHEQKELFHPTQVQNYKAQDHFSH